MNASLDSSSQTSRGRLGRMLSLYKPHLPAVLASLALAFVVNMAVIAKPWILKEVIDNYIATQRASDPMVFILALCFLGTIVAGSLTSYLQSLIMNRAGFHIMHSLRTRLFNHVLHLGLTFFDRNSSGRILTRITTDVEALNELYAGVLVTMVRDAVLVIGIVIAMFMLDAGLATVAVLCVPVIAFATILYRMAARKNFSKVKAALARINGFLAENISGMKIVQIFNREKEKFQELVGLDREYYGYGLREIVLNSFARPVVDVINNLTIAAVIVLCFNRMEAGILQIGTLYAFITYIRSFFDPISTLAEQYTSLQSAGVSADRIFELLDTNETLEDPQAGNPLGTVQGRIEFRDVWFAYREDEWILKGVSFVIESGSTAAFVGATGSGKSTIIALLARFYDIQRGSILLDGTDIRSFRLADLRRTVSVVIQDVFLFSGTIQSNVRLGDAAIGNDAITHACKLANADGFIQKLPAGYSEVVRERGCTLSSGQRQLLSFARAIAGNPAILVLDEATANIDTHTEAAIQKAIRDLRRNRTVLVVAHRLSTIRDADIIIVLDQGTVLETGTHETLLAHRGRYYDLLHMNDSQHAN